jgi:hypothetical protein
MKGLILFEGTKTLVNGNSYNVTEVLKKYPNKRASDWWKSKDVEEYASKIANKLNVDISTLYQTTQGRGGQTIIHDRLAILFARWIDADFAIACDDFILNHIKSQQSQLDYFWDKEDQKDLYIKS